MPTREEYESALRGIVMLADTYGQALNRGFRVLADGALIGPHGVELERAMVDHDRAARRSFSHAFDQVKWLAGRDPKGPPAVAAPHLDHRRWALPVPAGEWPVGTPACSTSCMPSSVRRDRLGGRPAPGWTAFSRR